MSQIQLPGGDFASLVDQAKADFVGRFGCSPQWVVAAPGRVNLIGDHTDYNDGFCLPFAINRYTVICAAAAKPPSDAAASTVTVVSGERHSEIVIDASVDSPTTTPIITPIKRADDWSDYPRGVLEGYRQLGAAIPSLQLSCQSNLPIGAGLSSSASLEVATAHLIESVCALPRNDEQMIRLCQRAEHDYAKVPCGLLDQFAVTMAQAGRMMLFDARDLVAEQVAFADPERVLLVINSKVEHALGASEYPTRRRECDLAMDKLGCSLRDADLALIDKRLSDEPLLHRRARHVISENQRVQQAAQALQNQQWQCAGGLMYASHASLRDDYQVSCPETDALVAAAAGIGEDGGVYGARMTGGGFGGSVICLIERAAVAAIVNRVRLEYLDQTGIELEYLVVEPVDGARVIQSPT